MKVEGSESPFQAEGRTSHVPIEGGSPGYPLLWGHSAAAWRGGWKVCPLFRTPKLHDIDLLPQHSSPTDRI